jgi:hypothetical protein
MRKKPRRTRQAKRQIYIGLLSPPNINIEVRAGLARCSIHLRSSKVVYAPFRDHQFCVEGATIE